MWLLGPIGPSFGQEADVISDPSEITYYSGVTGPLAGKPMCLAKSSPRKAKSGLRAAKYGPREAKSGSSLRALQDFQPVSAWSSS